MKVVPFEGFYTSVKLGKFLRAGVELLTVEIGSAHLISVGHRVLVGRCPWWARSVTRPCQALSRHRPQTATVPTRPPPPWFPPPPVSRCPACAHVSRHPYPLLYQSHSPFEHLHSHPAHSPLLTALLCPVLHHRASRPPGRPSREPLLSPSKCSNREASR
jgi:hypothetical protein